MWFLSPKLHSNIPMLWTKFMIIIWHPCLSLNSLLNLWLTPRVLQPSPLRESHLEIWNERLLREEKHVIHFFTSAIALGYLILALERLILSRQLSNLSHALCSYSHLKSSLYELPWGIVTLGGILDSSVLHPRDTKSVLDHKLTTHKYLFL
jgi:hypothetical protein